MRCLTFALCLLALIARCETGRYVSFEEAATAMQEVFASLVPTATSGKIFLESSADPFLKATEGPDGGRTVLNLSMSESMLDLLNRVAHAKAIDKHSPGFLVQYARRVAQAQADGAETPVIDPGHGAYWNEEILNGQRSNLNQMLGVLVAMELFQQHSVALKSRERVGDWEDLLVKSCRVALDSGYATEGIVGLFEFIDASPSRPAWSATLYPGQPNLAKLKKKLTRLEENFLNGK